MYPDKHLLILLDRQTLAQKLVITVCITLVMAGMGWSQTLSRPEISAVKIFSDETIRMDGTLDETVWQRASVANNFVQRDPNEGEPASEKTEVRVLYDDQFIYFGIICFDSSPELIRATELARDDKFDNDDEFVIALDTFHDHRNAYGFSINPLGTRMDALITDETSINIEWNEKWEAKANINEQGWEAEIAIPFKSLRSPKSEVQTWGLNFGRFIRRKNEKSFWSGWDRDYTFFHLSQAGHLTDLKQVQTGPKTKSKTFCGRWLQSSP